MAEQHNYGGKSYQVNQPQGTVIVGEGNQVAITYQTPPPARPRNEQILWEEVQDEVESRLTQSLHNQVLINLGKEAQRQQVNHKRPWHWEVKIVTEVQASQTLPEDLAIDEIFAQTKKHLLILGAPGSGKTTTLLDLAQVLLEQARTDTQAPLPVLVNLSSWQDDNQSIADWLREEIRVKYGVSDKLGQQWIEEKTLLPLLDGLDEVAAERQETCVQRINEFLSSEQRPVAVVVCSRTEEYGLYATNLQLQGAICLKPLTLEQMQDYLQGLGQTELAISLETDAGLRNLLEAPLLLSMAVLAFGETGMNQWRGLTTERERLTWLLDAYIVARLQKDYGGKAYKINKLPSVRKTRLWLKWLAELMVQQSQTEFLIEGLQPKETLRTRQEKGLYGLINGLSVGLILGLIFGLMGGLMVGLIIGLSVGLIFWLIGGLFFGLGLSNIEPVEDFNLSMSRETLLEIFRVWIGRLIGGLILGTIIGLIGWLSFGPIIVLIFGPIIVLILGGPSVDLILGLSECLIGGLIIGLIYGLSAGLIFALKTDIKIRVKPNQGVKASLKNALILGAISLILTLVIQVLLPIGLSYMTFPDGYDPAIITHIATVSVINYCLLEGGLTATIAHLALRVILTFSQRSTPWNYARFLNYCTELTLLQRVGGRYRFIHKLLQDHFAAMPYTSPEV